MVTAAPARLRRAIQERAACLFLSPHLDDAILSCGAWIQAWAGHCELTVATVFTAAGPAPHTRAARSFLRQCGAGDAAGLFAARRAEDRRVLAGLGAAHRHLGLPDALFRRRTRDVPLSRLVPELAHRYPTYRFDIARGRIARGDRALTANLAGRVADLLTGTGARLLFCPIGVGRHVDHLIVREVGPRFADRVVYYADFPYNLTAAPDPAFVARQDLVSWAWDRGLGEKSRLIRGYATQADALFPDGRIPVVPERFYVAAS
jgi:LmbE family N-acetylglucosaminyl deacetylase